MSTFTIGRIGVDTSAGGDGTSLQHPFDWQQSGRQVQLQGLHVAATDAAAVWLQQQILGLDPANNPDEEWVPVTSSTVSDLNGYFRITSATANIPRGSLGTGSRVVEWSVTMERAPAWRRPITELTLAYATITNSYSVSNVTGVIGLPESTAVDWQPLWLSATYATRAGENGTAEINYPSAATTLTAGTAVTKFQAAPGSYYSASAYVESATRGKIIGRADAAASDDWRIGNGLVRAGSFSSNTFSFQWWNGSSWATGTTIKYVPQPVLTGTRTFRTVSVLRNSPDECAIRLVTALTLSSPTVTALYTLDLVVRRGERLIRCYAAGVALSSHLLGFNATTASTSTTWGIRSTATINSEYVIITSDNATTKDTTNGSLGSSNPATGKTYFGLGVSSGGTTNGIPDGSDSVSQQAFVTYGSTQRVAF